MTEIGRYTEKINDRNQTLYNENFRSKFTKQFYQAMDL